MVPDALLTAPFAGRIEIADSGCLIFTGAHNQDGYGMVGWRTYGTNYAHRLAYTRVIGPVPDGHALDHLCRVRPCVNPYHLEPVLPIENTRRGFVGWINNPNSLKTHCVNGHEFTPENTRIESYKGKRQRRCIACVRARQLAQKEAS